MDGIRKYKKYQPKKDWRILQKNFNSFQPQSPNPHPASMETIKITIPKPCHENWETMSPADKGRFCSACQKTVLDFTNAPDRLILQTLQSQTNACGRFRPDQLNRDLISQKSKPKLWGGALATLLTLLSLGADEIQAQEKPRTDQTDARKNQHKMGETAAVVAVSVSGMVQDRSGLPIPTASVTNLRTSQSTTTDFDGKFTIDAKPTDTLEISFLGYKSLKQALTATNPNQILTLKMHEEYLGGVIVTGKPVEQPNLIRRASRKISCWFR